MSTCRFSLVDSAHLLDEWGGGAGGGKLIFLANFKNEATLYYLLTLEPTGQQSKLLRGERDLLVIKDKNTYLILTETTFSLPSQFYIPEREKYYLFKQILN